MNARHTPGPWDAVVPPSSMLTCRWVKGPKGESVALIGYRDYTAGSQDADLANARLIAAAPDLLALVAEGAELCAYEEPDEDTVAEFRQRCKAALAKVAG